jgi:hypothetical protein
MKTHTAATTIQRAFTGWPWETERMPRLAAAAMATRAQRSVASGEGRGFMGGKIYAKCAPEWKWDVAGCLSLPLNKREGGGFMFKFRCKFKDTLARLLGADCDFGPFRT